MLISRREIGVVIVAVMIIGGVMVWRSYAESDRDKIVRTIETGKEAIEEKSLRTVMGVIAEGYHDNLGLNREQAKLMLQRLFFGVQGLRVDLVEVAEPALELTDAGGTARVVLSVVVSGAWQDQTLYLMGLPDQPKRLTLVLKKEKRNWLVTEVTGLQVPALQ